MDLFKLLFLAAVVATVYCDSHKSIGEFNAYDGATCKMLKLNMPEDTHAVIMECTCTDSAGKKKVYACSYYYDGEFDKCIDEDQVYKESITGLKGLWSTH